MGANFKIMGGGCCCCPELALLTDTTGSMGGYIGSVQTIFHNLSNNLKNKICKWLVASYKDTTDGGGYLDPRISIDTAFTANFTTVVTAIDSWGAGGGGDTPEEQLSSLVYLATYWDNPVLGGKKGGKRVLLWAGDASGHEGPGSLAFPYDFPTLSDVVTALKNAKIKVYALNINHPAGNGLDTNGQASTICSATGGALYNSVVDTSVDTIVSALTTAIES